jgi:IS30 family transposase
VEGCSQNTPQCAPHLQGLRSPPEKKIASAAVTTTRSNRTLSRLKTTTQTNNSVRTRIRVALVINSSLRSRDGSIFVSHFAHPLLKVLIGVERIYKLIRLREYECVHTPRKNSRSRSAARPREQSSETPSNRVVSFVTLVSFRRAELRNIRVADHFALATTRCSAS